MPRVTFFEIPADTPDRAMKFYKEVFGWQFEKWEGPMEYWLVRTGSGSERGIDGGLMKRSDNLPTIRNVIDVSSIDEYSAKITSNGGKLLMPKTEIPGIGFFSLFQDTEGNVFGMMQENR
jgi:predicted enzyme related to lactoylglutathione lyase